ncbi:unnamed protein product [Brassica rapa]|uniref:Uncharacterized protein n=1 Tax=Brassica campestris TaxID=3711 RepID=A0A3P5YRX9_BRACM|nr:unnamed protein product [Brassica rapa]VDC65955.1 unnamed protein product [Brassica rapa]
MAEESKQSSFSDDKTSVIGRSSKEEKQSKVHEKETHGTSEDINEKTRVDDVKGPGVFGRMKEEVEAIVDAVTPSKSSADDK